MRTFQFSDAKSHKFWSIDVNGVSFTVNYGKVGTAGQTQTKTFASPEKAQAEAEKLIREKTGKGYRENTPSATVSQTEAFELGLIEHRHELVRWSAFADSLTEQNDPRGEFMQVQIALEDETASAAERKKLQANEKKLLAAHEREWLGPLAEFTLDGKKESRYRDGKQTDPLPPVEHSFERGWLGRVVFDDLNVNQARALSACPSAKLLREIVIYSVMYDDSGYEPGPDIPEDTDSEFPSLASLCRCPHLQAVRVFGMDNLEDNNCHLNGELAHHIIKQMPNIEEIRLFAHRVDANKLFALPMPNLTTITLFHSVKYPLDKLAANKTLTNLETIRCHPHAMEYDNDDDDDEGGAYIRLKHLRAICRSPHLTKLKHLCLRLTDFGDEGVQEIISSGLLKRLRVLDLQGGCISDEGAAALAASPDLKKLELLNLRSNALTDIGVRAIRATNIKADVSNQHTTTSRAEAGDTPEYLYEGDIE
jgi:uncharacterized protein (TIGR02996 family)